MWEKHVNGFHSLKLDMFYKPYPNDDYLMPIHSIEELQGVGNNDLGSDVTYILNMDYGEYIALKIHSSVFDIVYHDEWIWGLLDDMKIEDTCSSFTITFDDEDAKPLVFVFKDAQTVFQSMPKVEDMDE
jgi:hypothetical protein